MRLVFRPQALRETLDAQAWYEARATGLGLEFARAVEVAVSRLLRSPLAFPVVDGELRSLATRRFPYSLIYYASDDEVVISSPSRTRRLEGRFIIAAHEPA